MTGLTFPVEDILEKTRYIVKSEFDNLEGGNSRRRRRQQDSKKDPLTELFEAIQHYRSLRVIYGNTAEDLGQFNIEFDDSSITNLVSSAVGKLEDLPLALHSTYLTRTTNCN
ncbi:hypothetical protein ACE6H2_023929 [Prunus campanulata]